MHLLLPLCTICFLSHLLSPPQEKYVSAEGIVAQAQRLVAAHADPASSAPSLLVDRCRADVVSTQGPLQCREVFDLAGLGDALALHIVDTSARLLAIAIVNLCRLLDTDAVVLGGGVAAAGPVLIDAVRRHYDSLTWRFQRKDVMIVQAKLGNDAGFVGAAKVARDQLAALETREDAEGLRSRL
jgi:glucokinase